MNFQTSGYMDGTASMLRNATRSYAYSLYGDSDEASVLNAFFALEIQKNLLVGIRIKF